MLFPMRFELSPFVSPLKISLSEQRFSSKQVAHSTFVFSPGLRFLLAVTDSNVHGTCFSCRIGIGNASKTTPETQQMEPTILPRIDDGTTSP